MTTASYTKERAQAPIDPIIYATDKDVVTVAPLKKRSIGFGDSSPQEMITHLRTNMCIKINTKEEDTFKPSGYCAPVGVGGSP